MGAGGKRPSRSDSRKYKLRVRKKIKRVYTVNSNRGHYRMCPNDEPGTRKTRWIFERLASHAKSEWEIELRGFNNRMLGGTLP